MKISELNQAVLDLLSDSVPAVDGSYRWTPADLLRWLNDGRRAVFNIRPQSFYVRDIVTGYPGDKQSGDDLDVIDGEIPPLMNYMVYRCLSRDNEDPETGKAAGEYFTKFIAGV